MEAVAVVAEVVETNPDLTRTNKIALNQSNLKQYLACSKSVQSNKPKSNR